MESFDFLKKFIDFHKEIYSPVNIPFYTPWKHQKTKGFRVFSRVNKTEILAINGLNKEMDTTTKRFLISLPSLKRAVHTFVKMKMTEASVLLSLSENFKLRIFSATVIIMI